MEPRKLVKAGPSSHTVSLPKAWLQTHKLGKGSTVYVQEHAHGLLITPSASEAANSEKVITVDKKSIETIGRELTSAYVNNYSTIVLTGKFEAGKDVRRLLRDFAGLEIVEQTPNKLVAQDLLNIKEVSVEKTFRRMDMTVRTMFQECAESMDDKSVSDGVSLRDYDVNRMFFLLMRLLKGSLRNPSLASQVGVTHDAALTWWTLASTLEAVGDSVKNLAKQFQKLKQPERAAVLATVRALEQSYLDVMKAQANRDMALADAVAQRWSDLHGQAAKLLAMHTTPSVAEVSETCKALASHVATLARAVLDHE